MEQVFEACSRTDARLHQWNYEWEDHNNNLLTWRIEAAGNLGHQQVLAISLREVPTVCCDWNKCRELHSSTQFNMVNIRGSPFDGSTYPKSWMDRTIADTTVWRISTQHLSIRYEIQL